MKKLILITLLISIISINLLPIMANTDNNNNSTIVYITKTGDCYHMADCRYLAHSMISITLKDAVDRGYRPCSICNPPVLTVTSSTTAPLLESKKVTKKLPNTGESPIYPVTIIAGLLLLCTGLYFYTRKTT